MEIYDLKFFKGRKGNVISRLPNGKIVIPKFEAKEGEEYTVEVIEKERYALAFLHKCSYDQIKEEEKPWSEYINENLEYVKTVRVFKYCKCGRWIVEFKHYKSREIPEHMKEQYEKEKIRKEVREKRDKIEPEKIPEVEEFIKSEIRRYNEIYEELGKELEKVQRKLKEIVIEERVTARFIEPTEDDGLGYKWHGIDWGYSEVTETATIVRSLDPELERELRKREEELIRKINEERNKMYERILDRLAELKVEELIKVWKYYIGDKGIMVSYDWEEGMEEFIPEIKLKKYKENFWNIAYDFARELVSNVMKGDGNGYKKDFEYK